MTVYEQDTLGITERRGTLTYSYDGMTFQTMEGWFMLSPYTGSPKYGRGVIARKIRGRNHFTVCSHIHVCGFKAAAK
jgi:hypothetical protein